MEWGTTLRVFPAQRRVTPQNDRIFKIRYLINHRALEASLAFLELLDSVNYVQTTREYGVDPTTLRHRHKGKQVSRHQAAFESKSPLIEI
jgi:hypothetical protein